MSAMDDFAGLQVGLLGAIVITNSGAAVIVDSDSARSRDAERREDSIRMARRKAYPGVTLDAIVDHGIGVERGAGAIANVIVNGKRLGEVDESLRTPKKYEIRPETKYREAWSIAAAAVCLGLRDVQIETHYPDGKDRERPDALLRYAYGEVAVEAVRVAPWHHEHDFVMNLQRELLEAVEINPALKAPGFLVTFRMTAIAIRSLTATDRRALKTEIIDLLRSGRIPLIPANDRMTTVFPAGSTAERAGMSVSIEDRRHRTSGFMPQVLLEQDARSDWLVQPILDQVGEKCASAKAPGYDLSRPLWLVVEVADPTGLFTDSIIAMPPTAEIEPFEQVVVTDGMTHAVIRPSR